ncbi:MULTISPECIES: PRK06770 family protein [Bacillus]|uniref:PRK06770 family protein n=1 Tax=Bacillus TaxID=1386 RepID=UPI0011A67137|nr:MULTISPECIES: PRK06770 family protein [Bacillus]MCP1162220.1 PRK06770 family protein [Bacillus sp. 1813sda1]MDC7973461.1 PRK06770 family protein [Bacillus sp. BLCC-B18]
MLFKWSVGICITIMVIITSIVGGNKLLAYVEKENKNIQTQRVANEKEKKVAEEASQVSEGEIISTMHKMVHQKVKSSEKWGFVEMTTKEIYSIKKGIENSIGFQYKTKLLSIINRWEKGDFSQTVEEHNFLWSLQGGDTGKATERLSSEEEKQYIKEMKAK